MADAGEATISSQADLATAEMSRPAADCWRARRRAPVCRRASLDRRSAWIWAKRMSIRGGAWGAAIEVLGVLAEATIAGDVAPTTDQRWRRLQRLLSSVTE